ncbi:MAG: DNA polymerase III subunit beta [Candidatus Neomarinimicrobiota bacterium]
MKFVSDQHSLQTALQQLGKVTPTRSTLPILSSVVLSTEEDRLSLRATDLEISQVIYIPTTVSEVGSVAVQQRTILEIVSEVQAGDLEVEVDENRKLVMKTSLGKYSIMGKPIEEFPSLPEIATVQEVRLSGNSLKRIIEKTTFAASRDELKPSLMGVLFQFHEDTFKAVATDGHRLVKHVRSDYKNDGYRGDSIIPIKFLHILSTYLVDNEDVTLNISENHIFMSNKETVLFSRIIDERFPDYESVFPKDNDKHLKVDRDELLSAIRRVSIFSNKTTHQIALRLSQEGMEITTEDVETMSEAKEALACEYEGEPLVIGYNSNYVRDLISHIDSQKIHMEFRTPVTAAIIYPDEQQENEELTMLIMPIRLND